MEIKTIKAHDIGKFVWTGSKTHLDHFQDALSRADEGKVTFFGVYIDDQAVGRCGIDFVKHQDGGTLWMLNVRDDYQGQGIGTKLINFCESEIIDRNLKYVYLNVEKNNKDAIRLYERLGYEIINSGKESWDEELENGEVTLYIADVFIMRKTLPTQ